MKTKSSIIKDITIKATSPHDYNSLSRFPEAQLFSPPAFAHPHSTTFECDHFELWTIDKTIMQYLTVFIFKSKSWLAKSIWNNWFIKKFESTSNLDNFQSTSRHPCCHGGLGWATSLRVDDVLPIQMAAWNLRTYIFQGFPVIMTV